MAEIALLPCPFCGSPASFEEIVDKDDRRHCNWSVGCSTQNCVAFTMNFLGARKAEVAKAWNKRAYEQVD